MQASSAGRGTPPVRMSPTRWEWRHRRSISTSGRPRRRFSTRYYRPKHLRSGHILGTTEAGRRTLFLSTWWSHLGFVATINISSVFSTPADIHYVPVRTSCEIQSASRSRETGPNGREWPRVTLYPDVTLFSTVVDSETT